MILIRIKNTGIDAPVGEKINYHGITVEAFDRVIPNCYGCCFENNCDRELLCNNHERDDKKDVKFKKCP